MVSVYNITLFGGYSKTVYALTAGKAKYELFRILSEVHEWDEGFKGFLKSITSCRTIRKFNPSDLFNNNDTFENVKKCRNLDFIFLGMKVEMDGKKG